MMFLSTNRTSSLKALLGAMLGGLVCFATSSRAQNDLDIELGGE